jgi:hypothetical protein
VLPLTPGLRDAIIDVLADLLVADYQQDAAATVESRGGTNRE